jgi:hypothetical protein
MRYPLLSVLLCALITAATSALAATYKYVNENGETVYSQTPPPAGTEGVERMKAPPRPARKSGSAEQKNQEDATTVDERQSDKKTAAQDQKKMQQAEAERKKQCEQMRQDVETLINKPVVRRASEDGGEPVVLTGEEREAEVKALRESLKKNCK